MNKNKLVLLLCLMVMPPAFCGEGHAHEDEHGDEHGSITIAPEKLAEHGIRLIQPKAGHANDILELPAEVRFDPNQVVHLSPRVSGNVIEVTGQLGQRVHVGDPMLVLESGQLARAKADYLAALARLALDRKNHERERQLFERGISPEQDFLEAENRFQESSIEVRRHGRILRALGLDESRLEALREKEEIDLGRYTLYAPMEGIVTRQHAGPGESMKEEDVAFVIVNPEKVWIIARAFERDLAAIRPGLPVTVGLDALPGIRAEGSIDFVDAELDVDTRTARVRVILDNRQGLLRQGMLASVSVVREAPSGQAGLVVPTDALQRQSDGEVVYVQEKPGQFEARPVRVISRGRDLAVIVARGDDPLEATTWLAAGNTFLLKSEAGIDATAGSHAH